MHYMALPGGFPLPILYLKLQSLQESMCLHREPLSWAELEAAALDVNPRCTAVLPQPPSSPAVPSYRSSPRRGCHSVVSSDIQLPSVRNGARGPGGALSQWCCPELGRSGRASWSLGWAGFVIALLILFVKTMNQFSQYFRDLSHLSS